MKRPQRSFRFTPVDDRRVVELAEALSLSKTEVVRLGIAELHNRKIRGYRVWSVPRQDWLYNRREWKDPDDAVAAAKAALDDDSMDAGNKLMVFAVSNLGESGLTPCREFVHASL